MEFRLIYESEKDKPVLIGLIADDKEVEFSIWDKLACQMIHLDLDKEQAIEMAKSINDHFMDQEISKDRLITMAERYLFSMRESQLKDVFYLLIESVKLAEKIKRL